MNKIIFANNPLDRMSGFRSDKDWQKANLLDNETRFVVFHSGKPLIHVSSEPGSNSTIFLATYDQIKNFIEDAYLLFLGKLKNKSYYAIDLSKSNKEFDKTAFPNCKFID